MHRGNQGDGEEPRHVSCATNSKQYLGAHGNSRFLFRLHNKAHMCVQEKAVLGGAGRGVPMNLNGTLVVQGMRSELGRHHVTR